MPRIVRSKSKGRGKIPSGFESRNFAGGQPDSSGWGEPSFDSNASANDYGATINFGSGPESKSPQATEQSSFLLLKWGLPLCGSLIFLLLLGQIAGFKFLRNAVVWLFIFVLTIMFFSAGVYLGVKLLKKGYRFFASLILSGVLGFSLFTGVNVYAVTYDDFINKSLTSHLPPSEHLIYYARRGQQDYSPVYDESERSASIEEVSGSPLGPAIIAVEDQRLNSRLEGPIDLIGVVRASLKTYVLRIKKEGGSSLQVQISKLLTGELKTHSAREKFTQSLVALRIEQRFGDENHDKLLTLYINLCQIDGDSVGVARAAANLFGIYDLRQLSIAQSALLAGMLRSPSQYDPRRNLQAARDRRDVVLKLMHEQGMITEQQFQEALKEEIKLQPGVKKYELLVRAASAMQKKEAAY